MRGSIPMSNSTRHGSLSARRPSIILIDLPEDVIELIANRLDQRSFYNLASSHPRLRGMCRKSASLQRIKGAAAEDILTHLVSLNPFSIRDLDLSSCWLEARSLKALIERCRNVTKLNICNSSLKLAQTRDVLGTLEKLEDFSVTITQRSSSKLVFGSYPRIQRLYADVPPSNRLFELVGRFLEACSGVEYLHLNIVGDADDSSSTDGSILSAERVKCYRTIILSTRMQKRFSHQVVISRLFGADAFVHRCLLQSNTLDGIYWFEKENVNEEDPTRREPVEGSLSHRYQELVLTQHDLLALPDVYGTGQLGLRIHFSFHQGYLFMPDMSPLSSLVELDLTSCHLIFPTQSWWSLANSSAAVKALAVSSCSLCPSPTEGYSLGSILKALKRLDLTKLHVQATCDDRVCWNCSRFQVTSVFMEYISDFQNLDEFILNEVAAQEDFLVRVSRPFSMKTVKINPIGGWFGDIHLDGLAKFLRLCKNLRYLKLGSFNLRVARPQFWDALRHANLKQLCLSSSDGRQLEPEMLVPRISNLFRNLDVFHFHVTPVSDAPEIFSLIKDEARRVNQSRGDKPIHFIHTKLPYDDDLAHIRIPCFPGRNLCITRSFIGTVKPIGWDID